MDLKGAVRNAGLESGNDGKTELELELCWMVRIPNIQEILDGQEVATSELHEQWEQVQWGHNRNVIGRIRVRGTTKAGITEYTMACKVVKDVGVAETEMEITEDFFKGFRALAPSGFLKRRWKYKVEETDLVYEVDVFFDSNGLPVEWVKVDLEIPDPNTTIPPFPFVFEEMLSTGEPKDAEAIQLLYRDSFTTINHKVKSPLTGG